MSFEEVEFEDNNFIPKKEIENEPCIMISNILDVTQNKDKIWDELCDMLKIEPDQNINFTEKLKKAITIKNEIDTSNNICNTCGSVNSFVIGKDENICYVCLKKTNEILPKLFSPNDFKKTIPSKKQNKMPYDKDSNKENIKPHVYNFILDPTKHQPSGHSGTSASQFCSDGWEAMHTGCENPQTGYPEEKQLFGHVNLSKIQPNQLTFILDPTKHQPTCSPNCYGEKMSFNLYPEEYQPSATYFNYKKPIIHSPEEQQLSGHVNYSKIQPTQINVSNTSAMANPTLYHLMPKLFEPLPPD